MQYTTEFKRLVSCLLVFVMLLGMIPFSLTTASAASTGPFELPVEGSTGLRGARHQYSSDSI